MIYELFKVIELFEKRDEFRQWYCRNCDQKVREKWCERGGERKAISALVLLKLLVSIFCILAISLPNIGVFFFFFFGILAMMPKYILKNIILIYFNNIFINKKNSINILLNPFFPFHRSKFKLYLYIFLKSAHNHFEIVWNY